MIPTAFDAFAEDYDTDFTETSLARLLRARVWRILALHFSAGQHVLELACGTGEDAVWLAQRGLTVMATDGAAQMVQQTSSKAAQAGVSDRVTAVQLSLQEIEDGRNPYAVRRNPKSVTEHGSSIADYAFNGALSNFGGLNSVGNWRPLAESLAWLLPPGGKVVLVVMGPVCPWEVGWHLLHGQWGTAVRRFRASAPATIGRHTIPIWYPSTRRLRRDFAPWFRPVHTESLGLWLPPSYLAHLVDQWPRLFAWLNWLERKTGRLTAPWGDHYILVLEKTSCTAAHNHQ